MSTWKVVIEKDALALHTDDKVIRFDRLPGRVVLVEQVADLHNAATAKLRDELERRQRLLDDEKELTTRLRARLAREELAHQQPSAPTADVEKIIREGAKSLRVGWK